MAEDQIDAPSRHYVTRTAQQRPENRPVSYEDQDDTESEESYQNRRRRTRVAGGARSGIQTARKLSAPDLQKPTGIVLALLAANLLWTVWRTTVTAPGKLLTVIPQAVAGLWVVGLGLLIVAEFNPRLAMLFIVLVTIGNVLFNNAANQSAITALNSLFGQRKAGQ